MKTQTMALIFSALLLLCVPAWAQAQVTMQATPEVLNIGTTYNGTTLNITGTVPAGSDVVVRMIGAESDLHMKQKGKALGLLWMNMDTYHFEGVPNLYLVGASKPMYELDAVGEAVSAEAALAKVKIEPQAEDHDTMIKELIELKESEGLYQSDAMTFTMGKTNADGSQEFSAVVPVPSRLLTGPYTLETLAVKDGKILGSAKQEVKAELVSTPKFMSDLAFDHGTLYGVLASIIAILSGWFVGVVFRSKGGAH